MSVFTRFKDIVNSNINSLLDKAEDPQKLLKMMIQEMNDTIIELKTGTADRMAEAIRLDEKLSELSAAVRRWQTRAELAVEKGKDELAREALVEKKLAMETVEKLKAAIEANQNAINQGKAQILTIQEKIVSAKEKLAAVIAQEQQKSREKAAYNNINARFEDLENRLNRMSAYADLSRGQAAKESAESRFSRMESSSEIEEELEKIRKEKGL